ncbi:MAG: hypothetical protein JOY64_33960 [Alphaproteobacteria bacterium]|nr:hypothetical protein [Alphaproteobacteria bacterium]
MARSSRGHRSDSNWTVAHRPKPLPRIVRLGRPANDNHRRPWRLMHVAFLAVASALALIAILNWSLG